MADPTPPPMPWEEVATVAREATRQSRAFARIQEAALQAMHAEEAATRAVQDREKILATLAQDRTAAEAALADLTSQRTKAVSDLKAATARLDTALATGKQQQDAQEAALATARGAVAAAEREKADTLASLYREAAAAKRAAQVEQEAFLARLATERQEAEATVAQVKANLAELLARVTVPAA